MEEDEGEKKNRTILHALAVYTRAVSSQPLSTALPPSCLANNKKERVAR
jgi:hypothetical protein